MAARLRDTASHLVFAEGDPARRLLVIGEPPVRKTTARDSALPEQRAPIWIGMLASIGLQREAAAGTADSLAAAGRPAA